MLLIILQNSEKSSAEVTDDTPGRHPEKRSKKGPPEEAPRGAPQQSHKLAHFNPSIQVSIESSNNLWKSFLNLKKKERKKERNKNLKKWNLRKPSKQRQPKWNVTTIKEATACARHSGCYLTARYSSSTTVTHRTRRETPQNQPPIPGQTIPFVSSDLLWPVSLSDFIPVTQDNEDPYNQNKNNQQTTIIQ